MTLGAVLLASAAVAPSAQAQSCIEPVSLVQSSYPADGTLGVPTNAPLYVYGPELELGTIDVTLQDESGEAASIELQPVDGGVLVDAFLGLDANTTYELTVTGAGDEEWSATFTTGRGPATRVQLSPPDVTVSVINQDRGACGVVSAICVIGSVAPTRTLEVSVGDEVLSLGEEEPLPVYVSGGNVAADECVLVRQREPGGSASSSLRFCGTAIRRFELAASAAAPRACEPFGPAAATGDDEDEEPAAESGGCAMGAASSAASGAGGSLFGLCVVLAARWRSVRRRRARAGSAG